MKFFEKLTASAASAALAITSIGAGVALPEVAEAQTIREPQSCRLLDREMQTRAREDQRIAQRGSRDVGRAITRGGNLGDAARSIFGSQVEREISRATRDNSYIRDLQYRCAEERELLQAGVCRNNTRERGSVETHDGRVVGSARGRIDESRDCTSQTYGSPGNRTLTGGRGVDGALARERDLQDSGQLSRGSRSNTGRDFSNCAVGKTEMVCPTADGGFERIPLPAAPAPRR